MFADNLKNIMSEKDISQAELARRTGIGRSSISQYTSGVNMPRDRVLNKIAVALDVSVDDLLASDKDEIPIGVKNIAVSKAAKLMGVGVNFVKAGLRQNRFPFGTALKINGDKYSYYISPVKFAEYIGVNIDEVR